MTVESPGPASLRRSTSPTQGGGPLPGRSPDRTGAGVACLNDSGTSNVTADPSALTGRETAIQGFLGESERRPKR